MAEQVISAGVFTRENDQSIIQEGVQAIGAALVGPTVKGPVLSPTVVKSISEFESIFGTTILSGSAAYTYLTNLTAKNYFDNGGQSMLVIRIASGGFATANSPVTASAGATPSFRLETLSYGSLMNNSGSEVSGALVSGSADNVRWEITNVNTASGNFTLYIRRGNDTSRAPAYLETFTGVNLDPNSENYIGAIVGDQNKRVAIDTTANNGLGAAYIQITGSYANKSKFVRVYDIQNTPDYLDANGQIRNPAYTGSLPAAGSGSFSGGSDGAIASPAKFYDQIDTSSNTQGYLAAAESATLTDPAAQPYYSALSLLSNADEFDYNLMFLPGLVSTNSKHKPIIQKAINIVENRGDAMVVFDLVPYGVSSNQAPIGEVQTYNTSYAATYWPWVQLADPYLRNHNVWAPASVAVAGAMANSDRISAEWFAPAGLNRGGLSSVLRAERKLSLADRNSLYEVNINPIATFPGAGVVIYGQKTLQKTASALDRVNVRRLLISLKKFIASSSRYLVFEQNNSSTRNRFLSIVNPYLDTVQQRQGLYAYKVIMDDSINGPDVIDRNQLIGQIFLQPTRTAEFIILDFNVLPTGASFA